MRTVIHYLGAQGEILVTENVEYLSGRATEQVLQLFAKEHLQSLSLSQRCASAIKRAIIYTSVTSVNFE